MEREKQNIELIKEAGLPKGSKVIYEAVGIETNEGGWDYSRESQEFLAPKNIVKPSTPYI